MTNHRNFNPPDAWSWIRAFYFEPCKDSLILDGVWPALTPPCGCSHVRRAYFQRDWVGGPNVLVGLRACCEQTQPAETASRIEQYLAGNPSRSNIAATEHARLAESLVRHERNGQAGDLRPNNSVFMEHTEPEGPLVQHPPIKEAYRNYLCDSSTFCVDWLQEIRTGALDRYDLAVRLMIALLWLTDPVYLRSHVSLMSHAIGFFSIDRDGSIRHKFRAHYEGGPGNAIRSALLTEVTALERGNQVVPGMMGFVALLRNCLSDFYGSTKSKRYQPEPMIGHLDASPAWRSWQITISLLYRTLNQLGITPLERFLACYMISRACEDVYGVQALELKEIINRGPEGAESILTFFHQFA
jgi:hypothetical protein